MGEGTHLNYFKYLSTILGCGFSDITETSPPPNKTKQNKTRCRRSLLSGIGVLILQLRDGMVDLQSVSWGLCCCFRFSLRESISGM